MKNIQISDAVAAETKKTAAVTAAFTAAMIAVFALLHAAFPDRVPFDYRVILGGVCGGFVAVLNFLLMGLTVQKVVQTEDEELAKNRMKASYTQRTLMQMAWVVTAIVAPCFQFAAGILPLLFPSLGIKLMNIAKLIKNALKKDNDVR